MTTDTLSNIRIFFEGAVLSYRALFRWLRPSTYSASKVLSPLTMMIFFVYIGAYASGSNNASYYVIGNALIFTASSGIFGVTMSIGGERWTGTLPYLFGSPANRMAMFAGRSLVHILDGVAKGPHLPPDRSERIIIEANFLDTVTVLQKFHFQR